MKNSFIYLFLLVLIFIFGCSSSKEIGSERIVDRSADKKPDWIKQGSVKKDSLYCFTGEITKAIDRSFGMHQAYASGMIQVIRSLEKNINGLTGLTGTGVNKEEGDIGTYTSFGVAEKNKSLTISGVFNPETYWEKEEITKNTGVSYYYNCYSLLTISLDDYNKAIKGTLEIAKKKAQDDNNQKAETILQDLINGLKSN